MSVIYRQIPNLGPALALNGQEELEIVQAGVSLRSTVDQISSLIVGRVVALPLFPTGAAGGDLIGSYPNPLIRPGAENQVLTTIGGAATWRSFASGGTVTSVSVATVNGFSGVVASPNLAPVIGIRTTVTGLLRGDGQAVTAAVPGTDYVIPSGLPTSLPPSGPASGDLAGTYPAPTIKSSVALAGSPTTTTQIAGTNNTTIATTGFVTAAVAASPAGTVTSVSVVTANGLGGTVATATSTPAITLRTTITGLLKGDGTAISAGVAGTDYVTPGGLTTALGAYLPLTGGTLSGLLTGQDARFNAGFVSLFGAAQPGIDINATSNAANEKIWNLSQLSAAGGAFCIDAMPDSWAAPQARWQFNRAGSTVLPGALTGTTATFSGNVFPATETVGQYGTLVSFSSVGGTTNVTPTSQIAFSGLNALSVQRYSAGINPGIINISKSATNTLGAQALVQATDVLGEISFNGSDGVKFIEGAFIRAEVDATPGLNDLPTRLTFGTTPDGSATPLTRMTISNAGAVTLTGPLTGTTAAFGINAAGTNVIGLFRNDNLTTNATAYVTASLGGVANGSVSFGAVNGSPNPYAYITAGAGLTNGLIVQPNTTFQGTLSGTTATMSTSVTTPLVTATANLTSNVPTGQQFLWQFNSVNTVGMTVNTFYPSTTNAVNLGTPANRWAGVYGVVGDFSGGLTGTTATFSGAAQAARLGVGMAPNATATSKIWSDGDITLSSVNHMVGGNLYYDAGWKYTGNGSAGAIKLGTSATDTFTVLSAPNNVAGGAGAVATPLSILTADPTAFQIKTTWTVAVQTGTAVPAGGTLGNGLLFSSTANFGINFGSGVPDKAMARGSLYLRSDGSPQYNLDGTAGGWTPLGGSITVSATAPSSPIDGQLWYNSDASVGGGNLYLRYNDGSSTAWVPASTATAGSVVQTVSFQTGAVATGTTIIPQDDTIPQITEGTEFMTCAITPRSATSKLIITVSAQLSGSATVAVNGALFRDAVANALAGSSQNMSPAFSNAQMTFSHTMTSGTTSAITFRFRAGQHSAGTVTFNGVNGGRFFGGALASSIVIQEVL